MGDGEVTTIYIVTSGSYSDYGINAAFTDKALAERYLADHAHNNDEQIEEYEADPTGWIPPAGMEYFSVKLARNGDVLECRGWGKVGPDNGAEDPVTKGYCYDHNHTLHRCVATSCWARDKEHAIKIVGERRARFIASGEWDAAP